MPTFDHLLVIDIESTCWKGNPPEGQASDIIEIGVALLNVSSLTVEASESILVKPKRSTVSPFCTELTTLTQEMVDSGISLAEACAYLKQNYKSKNRVWASFGEYDRKMFEKSCSDLNIPYPFGSSHINVKTLYTLFAGNSFGKGMKGVLKEIGLSHVGTHHRGVDDAINIAAILGEILRRGTLKS